MLFVCGTLATALYCSRLLCLFNAAKQRVYLLVNCSLASGFIVHFHHVQVSYTPQYGLCVAYTPRILLLSMYKTTIDLYLIVQPIILYIMYNLINFNWSSA